MAIAAIVVSVLLAPAFLISGGLKVAGARQSLQIHDQLHVAAGLWVLIGSLELARAAGLLVGLWMPLIGIAAAVGLGLLMAGGIGAHLRASDARNFGPAALFLVLAVAVAILQITSLG